MKTIKLIYRTSIVLLLCVCLNACFNPKTVENLIDQETKDYCLFDQGSYWIYQDSATLETDSVIINNHIKYDYVEDHGEWNFALIWETYSTTLSCYSEDSISFFSILLSSQGENGVCGLSSSVGIIYHNQGVGNELSLTTLKRKTNYLINDITFNNTKIFEHRYYASNPNSKQKEVFYWAKHVGLVRMEVYENDTVVTVRNLIEHNVKPYHQ